MVKTMEWQGQSLLFIRSDEAAIRNYNYSL